MPANRIGSKRQPSIAQFRQVLLLLGWLVANSLAGLSPMEIAKAAGGTFTVNSNDDMVDVQGCDLSHCSLREAIIAANEDVEANTILFSVSGTIILQAELEEISGTLTVQGNAASNPAGWLEISRSNASNTPSFRLFTVAADANVTLLNLQLSNGKFTNDPQQDAAAEGGAIKIEANASLAITNLWLKNNQVIASPESAAQGGAIYVDDDASLTVYNSILQGNQSISTQFPSDDASTACSQGGAIFGGERSIIAISNSALIYNTALVQAAARNGSCRQSQGGAIYNSSGNINLINTTLSGNLATGSGSTFSGGIGGAIVNTGNLKIASSTLTGNRVVAVTGSIGGGIFNFGNNLVELKNSLIAANIDPTDLPAQFDYYAPNLAEGEFTSLGYNLIDNTAGGNITATTGDKFNAAAQPLLVGGLLNYQNKMPVVPILTGSQAIEGGNPAGCTDWTEPTPQPIATDQRGHSRVKGANCDIGAYEQGQLTVNTVADGNDGQCNLSNCTLREALLGSQLTNAENIIYFNTTTPLIIPNDLKNFPAYGLVLQGGCNTTVGRSTLQVSQLQLNGNLLLYGLKFKSSGGIIWQAQPVSGNYPNQLQCVSFGF